MNVKLKPEKYLKYLVPLNLFGTRRTREILSQNPTIIPLREDSKEIRITIYDYNADAIDVHVAKDITECFQYFSRHPVTWINIDGIRKADVETLSNHFGVHPLIQEDIMSINQRPKMDEIDNILFCLLNMLYYNSQKNTVEQEQISIVTVSYTHLRAHETGRNLVCRLLLEKKKKKKRKS